MNTRAKFRCISIKKYQSTRWENNKAYTGFLFSYEFQPVTGTSEENLKFFASTPTGHLEMSAVSDNLFEPGKEYYLDFSPAA